MARIAGVELPNQKRVEIGLTYIYGIGRTTSNQILAKQESIPMSAARILQKMTFQNSATKLKILTRLRVLSAAK